MEGSPLIIGQMCGHKQCDELGVSSFSKYQAKIYLFLKKVTDEVKRQSHP